MSALEAKRRADMAFNRMFRDEFLVVRKDVTASMLAAVRNDYDELVKCLTEKEYELHYKNRDGNTLLLLACANGNIEVARFLLDAKSDILHKNVVHMDALDYATINGLKDPLFKEVLSHCDYVVPDIIEGNYHTISAQAIVTLRAQGLVPVRASLIGNTPDFSDVLGMGTEYRRDWIRDLRLVCGRVKKGILLLNDDIAYLERDALLTGCLDVAMNRRYVFMNEEAKVVTFKKGLETFYAKRIEMRMVDAAIEGNAVCIKALLMARARPDYEDAHGQTLLQRAAHNGAPAAIRCLIAAAAPIHTKNKDGFDALMVAATQGNEKAVALLLKVKGDPTTASFKGYTALDFVRHSGHTRLQRILQASFQETQRLRKERFLPARR